MAGDGSASNVRTTRPSEPDGAVVTRRPPLLRRLALLVGELLVTFGVVVLLLVAYELVGTGRVTAHAQAQLRRELAHDWSAGPGGASRMPQLDLRLPGFDVSSSRALRPRYSPVPDGRPVAVLYLPSLSQRYRFVVVEGVTRADLTKGPGHYPGTALPGQLGNLVVSGHRTTYLAPFNRLDRLRPGDPVVFETAQAWWIYRVAGVPAYRLSYREVVDPSDVGETWPVPNHRGASPTVGMATLTTCDPKYSARQRLIVHAVYVRAIPKPTTDMVGR
jgi:sortase A